MYHSIELLYNEAKKAHLGLIDNRLIPLCNITIVGINTDTVNAEKFTTFMTNTIITVVPAFQLCQRNLSDIRYYLIVLLFHPCKDVPS